MKKRILTALSFGIMMVGCGQPAPQGTTVGKDLGNGGIVGDTVSIDEGRYGGTNGTTTQAYNSSSDGFQSVYFGFDRYDVSPEMQAVIAHNVHNAKSQSGRIRIEGNCDEFGSDEYNYALGLKRAKAVKDALVAQGIAPSRTVLVSYGESNPVCSEATETCYRRNRRADLRIVR